MMLLLKHFAKTCCPQASMHAVALLLCSLIFSNGLKASDVVDEQLTEQELSQVKKQITSLNHIIKKTQGRRTDTEKRLRQAELEISKTQKDLKRVNRNLLASKASIFKLRKDQKKLSAAKNRQTKALMTDISAAYQTGRQEYVKLMLNQENPEKLARALKYYDYFHQARIKNISTFNNTLTQLKDNQQTISSEQNKLERFKKQLETDKVLLNKAQERRKRVISKLNQSLESKGAQLKRFKSDESELQVLLDAVQETLADLPTNISSTPFSQRKGQLKWPAKGRISKRFGNLRAQGKLRWNGVIIKAPKGTAITAVHRGRVVFSDWLRGFGLLTILDHGDGYLSLYGNNEILNKEPGDWVEQGEVVSFSGKAEKRSSSGLYFELRHQGKPINPAKWCKS